MSYIYSELYTGCLTETMEGKVATRREARDFHHLAEDTALFVLEPKKT